MFFDQPFTWREYFLLVGLAIPLVIIMVGIWWQEERDRSHGAKVALAYTSQWRQFTPLRPFVLESDMPEVPKLGPRPLPGDLFRYPVWGSLLLIMPVTLGCYFLASLLQASGQAWSAIGVIGVTAYMIHFYRRRTDFWLPWRKIKTAS